MIRPAGDCFSIGAQARMMRNTAFRSMSSVVAHTSSE